MWTFWKGAMVGQDDLGRLVIELVAQDDLAPQGFVLFNGSRVCRWEKLTNSKIKPALTPRMDVLRATERSLRKNLELIIRDPDTGEIVLHYRLPEVEHVKLLKEHALSSPFPCLEVVYHNPYHGDDCTHDRITTWSSCDGLTFQSDSMTDSVSAWEFRRICPDAGEVIANYVSWAQDDLRGEPYEMKTLRKYVKHCGN